jgi:hypothetical protein
VPDKWVQGIKTNAVRSGDDYIINGQKTFISNGQARPSCRSLSLFSCSARACKAKEVLK